MASESLFPFSHRERNLDIERLTKSDEIFDVCIVGGGVTGAAIARDAALRGWKVLLVEKGDFGGGTSSRSSKLVHGGVRYLEQYDFGLVMESTRERARLWKTAPQLVTPIPFLFPAFKTSRVPLWKLNIGLWLYDLLAAFRTPSLHRRYGRARTLREEPELRDQELTGSIFYWDGSTDDALITLANILDAYQNGATTLSRVEFEKIEWNENIATDRSAAHTVSLKDVKTGRPFTARTRILLSAAGPWTDSVLKTLKPKSHKILAPTRGSHIVVHASRLPVKHAIVMMHPKDERVLFTIPWDEATIIGTTDLFDSSQPDRVAISSDEVDYLVDAANYYFPKVNLVREDVISTWSGLRPLLAPPQNASASEVSREHHIEWNEIGFLVIAGGKLTTHREMAEQAIERIYAETSFWGRSPGEKYRPTETHVRPLPTFEARNASAAKALGVSKAASVDFEDLKMICRHEMVMSIEDLFVRRTQIFYKEPNNGWDLLPKIRALMCEELAWNDAEWSRQIDAYRAYLEVNVLHPLRRALPT